jgi:hypothetical protein
MDIRKTIFLATVLGFSVLVTNHVSAQKIAIITPSAGTNYYTSETIQVSA